MATGLREGKLSIRTSWRQGWDPPSHAAWVAWPSEIKEAVRMMSSCLDESEPTLKKPMKLVLILFQRKVFGEKQNKASAAISILTRFGSILSENVVDTSKNWRGMPTLPSITLINNYHENTPCDERVFAQSAWAVEYKDCISAEE